MTYFIKVQDGKVLGYHTRADDTLHMGMTQVSETAFYKTRFGKGMDDSDYFERKQNEIMVALIRESLSADDEFKILREHQCGVDTVKFAAYNEFVAECKNQSTEEINAFKALVMTEI